MTLPVLVPEALTLVAVGALVLTLVALLVAWRAHRRAARLEEHYRALMTGADGEDVAAALERFARQLDVAETRFTTLDGRAQVLEDKLARAPRHVRLLRYRGYGDSGGDQSFTLALLDDAGDGVVLSGLHTRSGGRVYAKPIADGQSRYSLTDEEAQAIAEARAAPDSASGSDG